MASEEIETSRFLKDKEAGGNETQKEEKQSSDTLCGISIFKGPALQRFATAHCFVIIYGIASCFLAMAFTYFTGTITTMEKRFNIPTKISGLITVGNDISTVFSSAFLSYYASRGHRPRWVALGLIIIAMFCLLMLTPHFFYGPGEEALRLTEEYGLEEALDTTLNSTGKDDSLCLKKDSHCGEGNYDGDYTPIILFFVANFIGGIGCSLFYAPGLSYMDDNSASSKTPAMLSWSTFIRMLGPAMGFSMVSLCLRLYIDPLKKPLITTQDPRWMGAWWLGWILLTVILLITAVFVGMFPKEMPKAKARRLKADGEEDIPLAERSFQDMLDSLKRLAANKVYVYNMLASILYFFGYMPYWIFTPKYIEIQYRQSASTSTMATGTWALGFSAAGVLISGYVISKYKPSARAMAAWNFVVDYLTVAGLLCYVLVGCDESDRANSLSILPVNDSCSAACDCEYVYYAPVCSPENTTYISACHAGCTEKGLDELGRTIYTGCQCMGTMPNETLLSNLNSLASQSQIALDGACPVDCSKQFLIFMTVMCFLKFVGATGRSSNLLLALRCVPSKDKTFSLGFGSMVYSVLTFIPSPIVFGWMLDSYCLVWGKTCSSKGNCWIYDTKSLRYTMNLVSASLIFLGSFWNIGVWYHAKDMKVFDEEEKADQTKQDEVIELKEKPKVIVTDKEKSFHK
ncbi:LOW QUALITY PROTEIN: solute carrier organic anion transporter family member 74D [Drosophila ficusphila]|uniref:LOW QUALITY PROTEIN: solute carrier organic anion transporter family member 74D n=1 Tax=Drosophila ficusphila TaxID=30025 RepID=UPI001C898FF3|nr:LOW QUALITY PROTEIN: solute carrier organic anion transporter family member 74D [Drosophila ficusphila]